MPLARRPANHTRVIAHVDLDCFYVQVEQRRNPELRGKPTAVIQYNPWKGGACIAVGYEARKHGVKRSMRGDDAKRACPEINLVQVPVTHEKADLTIYRDAGSEVVAVLSRLGRCERASIDEVYLDITEACEKLSSSGELSQRLSQEATSSHIVGVSQDAVEWLCRPDASREDHLLACGAIIIAEIRLSVLAETQFTCSAGIAHNKMLAKLSSGMHKPSQQTLVPFSSVEGLLANLPTSKIGQLGGKLGHSLQEELHVTTVGDLLQHSEEKLQNIYGVNTGTWLWNIARGISGDEVQARTLPKSHSSGKTFPGPRALRSLESVVYWLQELAATLQDRLDEDLSQNNRLSKILTLHAACHIEGPQPEHSKFPSKSCPLRYGMEKIAEDSRSLFQRSLKEFCSYQNSGISSWIVTGLSITASNIVHKPMNSITQYFGTHIVEQAPRTEAHGLSTPNSHNHNDSTQKKISGDISPARQLNETKSQTQRKPNKLAELWERKASSSPGSKRKEPAFVEYNQEEIDEEVFAELPEEIQRELESRLGLKRHIKTKHSR